MLGPVLEGGAINLLDLDCEGQSVKSALLLYVSCLTPLQQRIEQADRVSEALNKDLVRRTSQDLFCVVFGFCKVTMGLCCSEKQKKNFGMLTSWRKVSLFCSCLHYAVRM